MGCIYLIEIDGIYKIGRTDREYIKRYGEYRTDKKNTKFVISVEKPKIAERILLSIFNKRFEKVKGNEYFKGNVNDMIKVIMGFSKMMDELLDIEIPDRINQNKNDKDYMDFEKEITIDIFKIINWVFCNGYKKESLIRWCEEEDIFDTVFQNYDIFILVNHFNKYLNKY